MTDACAYDGAALRAVRPVPGESYDWLAAGACMADPGAVCGNPRARGGSSSTLTPVCCRGTARSSSPKRLPRPAGEPRRSHRRVTRHVAGIRHRDQPSVHGDDDTIGTHMLSPNPCTSPVDRVAMQRPGNPPGTITSRRSSRGPVAQRDRPRSEFMAMHELELDPLS